MGYVTWSFLDLHPSYSGWPSPPRAVPVTQERKELDASVPAATGEALPPRVDPKPDSDSTPTHSGGR